MERVEDILDSVLKTQFEMYYVGTVVNDEDPEKLGRLKVRVPELYGNIPVKHLPWATPSPEFGGGGDYGSFWIPPKESKVKICLKREHPWFPEWYGTHWFKGEPPTEAQVLPPRNHVIKTPRGNIIDIHDVNEYIRIMTRTGSYLIFDINDGSLNIKALGNLNVRSLGNMSFIADGSMNFQSSGGTNLDGSTIHLNSRRSTPEAPHHVDHEIDE